MGSNSNMDDDTTMAIKVLLSFRNELGKNTFSLKAEQKEVRRKKKYIYRSNLSEERKDSVRFRQQTYRSNLSSEHTVRIRLMEQKYRSSLSKERKNKNRLRQCISRKKFLASKNQKPEPTDEEKEVKSRKRAAYRLSLSHDRFNSMHIRELASKKKYQDSMKGRAAIKRKNAAYYKSEKKN